MRGNIDATILPLATIEVGSAMERAPRQDLWHLMRGQITTGAPHRLDPTRSGGHGSHRGGRRGQSPGAQSRTKGGGSGAGGTGRRYSAHPSERERQCFHYEAY